MYRALHAATGAILIAWFVVGCGGEEPVVAGGNDRPTVLTGEGEEPAPFDEKADGPVLPAASSDWIALSTKNVRIPDPGKVGESLVRSNFGGAPLIPLWAPRLNFGEGGINRDGRPLTVRVVLDKVESLRPGLIEQNRLSLLGGIEEVTLIEGDQLEIYTWNGNYTGDAASVITGFALYGVNLEDLLDQVSMNPAPGGGAVSTVIGETPVIKGGGYFGQRLAQNRHGGFVLSGTVRRPTQGAAWRVGVQAVAAFSNQDLTAEIQIDPDLAMATYESQGSRATVHQQGQFYGGYAGNARLGSGDRLTLAAPGSWAYHGTDYRGQEDAEHKQAAYWVPIFVNLEVDPSRPPPSTLRFVTSTGQYVNPDSVEIGVRYPDGSSVALTPDAHPRFASGMEVRVTFLGTSATALAIEAE